MASRKQQKEQARQQRLAEEQAQKSAAQRKQRLQIIAAVAAVAVVVVVAVFAISSGGSTKASANPNSTANKSAQAHVSTILAGLPQPAGKQVMLGNPKAKVTITEYGDLECSACDYLDTPSGWENGSLQAYQRSGSGVLDALIAKYAKTGKVNFVYKSLETATGNGVTPNMWTTQQAAANAAALQGKGWQFIELFYLEQGAEGTSYVNDSFIEGLAKQIPGLDYNKWYSDWKNNPQTSTEVGAEDTAGVNLDGGPTHAATPTIYVTGPHHHSLFIGTATLASVTAAVDKNLGA